MIFTLFLQWHKVL